MNLMLAYWGRSNYETNGHGPILNFAPNLKREAVSFDAALSHPLRYREAMSALHDIVVSDLRFKPRDKTAYDQWKKGQEQRERNIFNEAHKQAKQEIMAKQSNVPPDFENEYNRAVKRYWQLRQKYSNRLLKTNPELWRLLTPCDPVVTVADDVVFFECFSADESSYGCLTVERDNGFGQGANLQLGTTNVDYSWGLYDSFQRLRSYKETRLKVDPEGFSVATEDADQYREEKIDLPPGWLRGFMQIQSAMTLPMRKVSLSRQAVYNLLAWYKRNKPRTSPRALRFELNSGRPPRLMMEPWEKEVVSHGTLYDGPDCQPIRIWGIRRLMCLARLLPLVESFDVYLLGTGMPSFWVARMGEMRLTLGLSGWTTNDWTRGSALNTLAPPADPNDRTIKELSEYLQSMRSRNLKDLQWKINANPPQLVASLNRLAETGQVIYDLDLQTYRWRQVMPFAVGQEQLGPPDPEQTAAVQIRKRNKVKIDSTEDGPKGVSIYTANVENKNVDLVLDKDLSIKRAKCVCSHHYKYGIRRGPCRHILALRDTIALKTPQNDADIESWYKRISMLNAN